MADRMNADKLLNDAMLMLAAQPNALFIGQGVAFGGVATHRHLEGIPASQRIELPVIEEMQVGMSAGLALQGFLPISIFPRMDFLLRAMDQLVNHLDKLALMSRGQFDPKIIIRTRVGSRSPLDAGPQHSQNHVEAFRMMLTNVNVYEIQRPESIVLVYEAALRCIR